MMSAKPQTKKKKKLTYLKTKSKIGNQINKISSEAQKRNSKMFTTTKLCDRKDRPSRNETMKNQNKQQHKLTEPFLFPFYSHTLPINSSMAKLTFLLLLHLNQCKCYCRPTTTPLQEPGYPCPFPRNQKTTRSNKLLIFIVTSPVIHPIIHCLNGRRSNVQTHRFRVKKMRRSCASAVRYKSNANNLPFPFEPDACN